MDSHQVYPVQRSDRVVPKSTKSVPFKTLTPLIPTLQCKLTYQKIDVKSRTDMPSPMTMQRPNPWIISLELHRQMAHAIRICLPQDLRIASGRVIKVARMAIPGTTALRQNEEVMAV